MLEIREARSADADVLSEALAMAVEWRPGVRRRPIEEVLALPEFAHYIDGWPRVGDVGVVAETDGYAVGAAWYRFLDQSDAGYGYVADDIPEMTIGVRDSHRGVGVGSALIEALTQRAGMHGVRAISFSVELDNPAIRLYERCGFRTRSTDEGAATMLLPLQAYNDRSESDGASHSVRQARHTRSHAPH